MKKLLPAVVLTLLTGVSIAQSMSFPNGKVLNLTTNKSTLYFETDMRFHTQNSVSTDYKWMVIFDSIDSRWELSACNNGNCEIGIPNTGTFIKDFGENDTTVFMRYHVATNAFTGASKIGVKVYHKTNSLIADTVWFNINYTNMTGLTEANAVKIDYAINNNTLQVQNSGVKSIHIYNLIGQCIAKSNTNSIQMPEKRGLYMLTVTFDNNTQSTQKLVW
jgi:hypothetical protein